MSQTVHRQCTLCEAHCGIDVEVDGDRVLRITGDAEDPISRGYVCPRHVRPGVGWRLAAEKAGASVNDITDPSVVDAITGNAAFNSVPVRVEAAG
jgi:predicted molibdopterin-dependent oxidoreductase YjgC